MDAGVSELAGVEVRSQDVIELRPTSLVLPPKHLHQLKVNQPIHHSCFTNPIFLSKY